jgi:AcrR family transcriptional regulator
MSYQVAKKKTETRRRAPVRTSREEIKEKAMELFLSKGYHGMSTSDICEGLGISRPTLYWYFRDKEEILFSVHKDSIENRIQPIVARMKEIDDPLRRLYVFIREHTGAVCLHHDTKALINETPYLAPEHEQWVRKHWADVVESVRCAVRELKEDGIAKDLPELFVAFSLIGMVMWPYTWFDPSKPDGFEDLVNTISEVFFSGIVKPGVNWRAHCVGGLNTLTKTREKRKASSRTATESARTGKKQKV